MKKNQYQDAIIKSTRGTTDYYHNVKKIICLKESIIIVQKGDFWNRYYNNEIIEWKAGTNLW